jgi:hypothetical protein
LFFRAVLRRIDERAAEWGEVSPPGFKKESVIGAPAMGPPMAE